MARAARRHQTQHDACDDPQRSFGTDEQLPQRQTRIVLADPAEFGQDIAAGEHRFEPEDAMTHGAVAECIDAAGVGRHHAADRRRAARAQVDTGGEPVRRQRLLEARERDPRLDRCRACGGVDVFDLIHAVEREDELAWLRRRSPGKSGPAALWNDTHARLRTQDQHTSDFGGVRRPDHQAGREVLRMHAGIDGVEFVADP